VLNQLGLVDRNDPAVLVVANRIIAFAKTGVLDPVQLRDLTIKAVRKGGASRLRIGNRMLMSINILYLINKINKPK
jgi:hypothetical protein